MANTKSNEVIKVVNINADMVTDYFPVDSYRLYGVQILTSGAGFTYDFSMEVSNTPDNPFSWTPRPDTVRAGLDQTSSPIGVEFETGFAYARIKLSAVTGLIDTFDVNINMAGL